MSAAKEYRKKTGMEWPDPPTGLRDVKLLLELFTKDMPPKKGQRHNITLDGDKLQVSLMLPEGGMKFHLEDDDMDTPISDLLEEVKQLYENRLRLGLYTRKEDQRSKE